MRKIILGILVVCGLYGCADTESNKYTGKEVSYELFQASDFEYTGVAIIKELIGGNLELSIVMEGEKGSNDISYPAHLHFGTYDTPNAAIAFMLNPVDASTLKSTTVLEQLTNGNRLLFNEILGFQGHIKVHLASDGPEYQTILVAGNIGGAAESSGFDKDQMAICGDNF